MVNYSIIYKGCSEDKRVIYTELNGDQPQRVIMKVYNTYFGYPETNTEITFNKDVQHWHYLVNNSKNRYVEFRDAETCEIVGLFGLEGTLDLKDYDYDNYVYNLMRSLPYNGKHNVCAVFNEIVCQSVYFGTFVDVEEGDVVVDIGFNYGLFSINALKKSPKRIVGFEPNSRLVNIFNKNVKDSIIEVHNCAVSNENEKIKFYESFNSEMSTIVEDFYRENTCNIVEVDGFSFMHLVDQHGLEKIDYLKVDCEGAEYGIFQAIPDFYLSNNVKKIAIEFHDKLEHTNVQNLINRLRGLGFETATSGESGTPLGMLYARK